MTHKFRIAILLPMVFLSACANPNPPPGTYKPICFQEGDMQVKYFRQCLEQIPEQKRTAGDLKACDDVSIVQASTQCFAMGFQP